MQDDLHPLESLCDLVLLSENRKYSSNFTSIIQWMILNKNNKPRYCRRTDRGHQCNWSQHLAEETVQVCNGGTYLLLQTQRAPFDWTCSLWLDQFNTINVSLSICRPWWNGIFQNWKNKSSENSFLWEHRTVRHVSLQNTQNSKRLSSNKITMRVPIKLRVNYHTKVPCRGTPTQGIITKMVVIIN